LELCERCARETVFERRGRERRRELPLPGLPAVPGMEDIGMVGHAG
jgi:hypothetical protein